MENLMEYLYDDDYFTNAEAVSSDAPDAAARESRHKVIEASIRQILATIGEDLNREGLQKTPNRIARMYDELTSGYLIDPDKLINNALFDVDYDDMVVVRDIEFYSLCEHHMVPFFGVAHVAYIPKGRVIGLSKIPRIVEMYARRLQVQERMTRQIATLLHAALKPAGVGVVVEGMHLCSMMRGVKKGKANLITSSMLGIFRSNASTRAELLDHLGRRF
jgi:GTP cyclohydrolase I